MSGKKVVRQLRVNEMGEDQLVRLIQRTEVRLRYMRFLLQDKFGK